MRRLLPAALGTTLLALLMNSTAPAGQNAGAVARIYWLTSNTVAEPSTGSTATTVKALVTVQGVSNIRGADLQLLVGKLQMACLCNDAGPSTCCRYCGYFPLPQAWQPQAWPSDATYFVPARGGFNAGNASIWPNIFKASPGIPGMIWVQDGYYIYQDPNYRNLGNSALIFWSGEGTAGVARDPAKEYALFGFTLRLDTGLQGGSDDPAGPTPVRVVPKHVIGSAGQNQQCLVLADGQNALDYVPFVGPLVADFATLRGLEWHPEVHLDMVPVQPATWGRLKTLYR